MSRLATKFEKIQTRKLIPTPSFKEIFAKIPFSPQEAHLLNQINGEKSVTDLATGETISLLESLQLIWILFSLRMIGMVQSEETRRAAEEARKAEEEAKAAALRPKVAPVIKEAPLNPAELRSEVERKFKQYEKENLFEILEVSRKSSANEIRQKYFRLAKRYHPDVLNSLGMNDLAGKAGAVFAKMTEAHETLGHQKTRKEYEASLDVNPETLAKVNAIVQAEMEFQKGEILLQNRSYGAAVGRFQKAVELNADEGEHYVYLGYSQFLSQKGDKTDVYREAKKLIQKGLTMRGNIDMGYLFLGRMAKVMKNTDEARSHFNKALQINPTNDQAEAELRVMDRKK